MGGKEIKLVVSLFARCATLTALGAIGAVKLE
jgi:hypothetical protein